ncbi:hypothetical protein AAFC00_003765 [Neodothiora populina]|uniref:Catechol dioxygenase n=1 Tax=Neodothiora populina TaxID=2781224 RepID=A0ABR3PGI8_9PEZI
MSDTTKNANESKKTSRFDPNFTQNVINAIGPKCDDRTREIFSSLITHLHDFAREVELTTEEWMAGVKFVNWIGQISTPQRNEAHRMSDVLGLESLVDEMAHAQMSEAGDIPTSSAILGPFWSPRAPFRDNGDTIIRSPHEGLVTLMKGKVLDSVTKKPIVNAVVDIWQASSNGKYDFQDPDNQEDNNLRGKFRTNENGDYWFYCLRPTAYSLPTDGPAGAIFKLLDRHPFRPAHIHLMITADNYKGCVTQIFPKDDPYIATDTVFAVKDDLVVDFVPFEDGKAVRKLELDLSLAPKDQPAKGDPTPSTA